MPALLWAQVQIHPASFSAIYFGERSEQRLGDDLRFRSYGLTHVCGVRMFSLAARPERKPPETALRKSAAPPNGFPASSHRRRPAYSTRRLLASPLVALEEAIFAR